jgi:membrane-associated HD superfamily phosphohydrolase
MDYRKTATIGIVALALSGACNRATDSRDTTARDEVPRNTDRAAELQQKRNEDISQLDKRVVEIERDYAEANQKIVSGDRTATAGLREELQEDVTNVKNAVADLRTTTPENWWDRDEQAMKRTADDIEEDVQRLAGKVTPKRPPAASDTTGEKVSTEPFTSRRDRFVSELRVRVDAMERALDNVKARGAKETEIEDVRARVKKLSEDVDRLRSASADDWWDVTKARVTEYVDRVERSVKRLDDNKS